MTREEEIREEIDLQLAGSFGDKTEGYEEGFIKGAKWADKTMIEKACDWIKNNKHSHKVLVLSFGSLSVDWDKFIKEFSKDMEL